MSVTLTVSEETYQKLENAARRRRLGNVEQFLEKLSEEFESSNSTISEEELAERRRVVDDIVAFRQKMKEKYGVMPDSTELLREDRMRG